MTTFNKTETFNMLIVGTGGQGQITLLQILSEAALLENIDFKSSELHGLSQRGGSVEVHIRLGQKLYSPMLSRAGADLILGLEMQESLLAADFANAQTVFLTNREIIPFIGQPGMTEKETIACFKKITSKAFFIEAGKICRQELGTAVPAGVYLISLASFKNIIPLKSRSILKAIKNIMPARYVDLNIKAFQLAEKSDFKI